MFDQADQGRSPWDDEPSEEMIREMIRRFKQILITNYRLQTATETDDELVLPKPFFDCVESDDFVYNVLGCAARNVLEEAIFEAKFFFPTRYHHLFDELLTEWLPPID